MENLNYLILFCVIGLFIGCALSYYVIRIAVSDALSNITKILNEINDKLGNK